VPRRLFAGGTDRHRLTLVIGSVPRHKDLCAALIADRITQLASNSTDQSERAAQMARSSFSRISRRDNFERPVSLEWPGGLLVDEPTSLPAAAGAWNRSVPGTNLTTI